MYCFSVNQYLLKLVPQLEAFASLPPKSNSRCQISLHKCSLLNTDYQFLHLLSDRNGYIRLSNSLTICLSFLNVTLHYSFFLCMSKVYNKQHYLMPTVILSKVFLWLIEALSKFFPFGLIFMLSSASKSF